MKKKKRYYLVRDEKDAQLYGQFESVEEAEEFVENDQNDHNLVIEEYVEDLGFKRNIKKEV